MNDNKSKLTLFLVITALIAIYMLLNSDKNEPPILVATQTDEIEATNTFPATPTKIPSFVLTLPSNTPTSTVSETYTLPPIPTETPTIPSEASTITPIYTIEVTPAHQSLNAKISYDIIQCYCDSRGYHGEVRVRINFQNGEPPFEISGQLPVKTHTATFNVPLGSKVDLVMKSFDGLKWEGTLDIPKQCISYCVDTPRPPASTPVPSKPQCSDGKDNDRDGKKDYPNDPGCSSKTDNSEEPYNL